MKLRKNYKHEGKTKTLHQWSKIKGIPYCDLLSEIRLHGNITKAIEAFKQAIKINSNDAITHFTLGVAYHELGKYQEAAKAYKQATMIYLDDTDL